MLNEIWAINFSLTKDFYKSLCKRIEERRIVHTTLLNFFKNSNKASDFGKGMNATLIKFELKRFAKGPERNSLNLDNSISDEMLPLLSYLLFDVIEEC